jgi:hypothetical protein
MSNVAEMVNVNVPLCECGERLTLHRKGEGEFQAIKAVFISSLVVV